MPLIHLTVRARAGVAPFDSHAAASWAWEWLRHAFPSALNCFLMPTHPHLAVQVDLVADAQHLFARILGHVQRIFLPGQEIWERVRAPKIIGSRGQARRDFRYMSLNANRAGLVKDPTEWGFTTHRDVLGAVADPWVDMERLARALGESPHGFRERWHKYVSSDPSCRVEGTPLPRAAASTTLTMRPLSDLRSAAAAALRIPAARLARSARGRRLFVALARDQGWTDPRRVAQALEITPGAVRRMDPPTIDELAAARLCLGDRRLLLPFADESATAREDERPMLYGPDNRPIAV